MVEREVEIVNKFGLHARPAALFVQTAARFTAEIQIARTGNEAKRINAKSINAVASFGVRQNETIKVYAAGADAVAPGEMNFFANVICSLPRLGANPDLIARQPTAPAQRSPSTSGPTMKTRS